MGAEIDLSEGYVEAKARRLRGTRIVFDVKTVTGTENLLMAAALAFTASFLAISIACDYRYLYFLDLAAMTGLLYLALDPPVAQVRRLLRR